MDKSLIKALQNGRRKSCLTQDEVAKQLGVKKNTISNYENGVSEPDIDTFCKLCKIYKIDVAKLFGELCGVRLLYNDFVMKPSEIEHLSKYRSLDKNGQNHLNYELNRELERINLSKQLTKELELARYNSQEYINLPYFSKITLNDLNKYVFDTLPTNTISVPSTDISTQADFIIQIQNDTMAPTYNLHDLIYTKMTSTLSVGDIGMFIEIDSDITSQPHCFIAEYKKNTLNRFNKKYNSILWSDTIRIIGKVIGKVSSFSK